MATKKLCLFASLLLLVFQPGIAQNITVQVNANQERLPVYKEAGLRFARENGGNNATKYNWRRKLGSHPDWYNNVYDHNWDFAAQDVQARMPGLQVMFAFQLIGKAAANKNNNFNDWLYNGSNWWSGVGQNLAGGGQVNPAGGYQALVNGNPDLYLENWTADSKSGACQ